MKKIIETGFSDNNDIIFSRGGGGSGGIEIVEITTSTTHMGGVGSGGGRYEFGGGSTGFPQKRGNSSAPTFF